MYMTVLSVTAPPAPTVDHTAIWTVLIVQVVAIAIFAAGLLETRRRDRLNREAERARDLQALVDHQEKERETLRLNMKREVFLEVAPAIQRNYMVLSRFVDIQLTVPQLSAEMRTTLQQSADAISKLQAVAGNETLEAARQVQTMLGTVYVRLLVARMHLGARSDIAAIREIATIWQRELAPFPGLMSTMIACARDELHLVFDRQQFEAGMIDSNVRLFAELEQVVGPL